MNTIAYLIYEYYIVHNSICQGGNTMIIYNKLWDTMKKKEISTYRLRELHGFNTKTIAKLRQNGTVTTKTLDKLCDILNCELSDIAEYRRTE